MPDTTVRARAGPRRRMLPGRPEGWHATGRGGGACHGPTIGHASEDHRAAGITGTA
ncbi:hypothetical protein OG288_11945 [Streptomyces tauricus]|uniref:Uncharacterized protein n=1 Tax=Streptomyces tauricus TaxID=68274 RepID=A0ABZ1JEX5_9ACTN|nr:hypothetical protein [Streptomyces tauricus]MCW8095773.1 hypothetical protein [Streptomyces tauricus]